MTLNTKISWKRISVEMAAIVGSILLAFAIDAWWDDFRDREEAKTILKSLHDELVRVAEFMSWHDQFAGAIRDSASQLLSESVGRERELSEEEIDRLLADLTYWVGTSWFEVPELESLVISDDLSLIQSDELRSKLRSWRSRNEFFRSTVEHQAVFVNERFMPFLEENASLQQIFNVSDQVPGVPDELFPVKTMELGTRRSHSSLLDDLLFQNLLTRRIQRLDMMLDARDEEYVSELHELIAMVVQEMAD